MSSESCILEWDVKDVASWLEKNGFSAYTRLICDHHRIDGKGLLLLTQDEIYGEPLNIQVLGDVKRLALRIHQLQRQNVQTIYDLGYDPQSILGSPTTRSYMNSPYHYDSFTRADNTLGGNETGHLSSDTADSFQTVSSDDDRASKLPPEIWKTVISLGYLLVVTWITSFVMVIVHYRVPDMKKYPPLPDIFLDNVPLIPWAFFMSECTGGILFLIWVVILLFHKHRFILLRRFFALCGTVFLLRCVTMLITSLSVPGTHLECAPADEKRYADLTDKIIEAYRIWRGAGMTIRGVKTCGDYMFSGHTVALTMLNFFITEYTSRSLYFLHIFSWLLNMFGIFFILAAHEHYSIDVFIAFYISSRLFLYYHTLANNQALMQRDSDRTRIWFPLFSFFESKVDGIVPNEFESPSVPFSQLILSIRDCSYSLFLFLHPNRTERHEHNE